MNTIDRIREILSVNPSASTSEIAREIGVSRQRISQVCAKEGIKLKRAYPASDRKPSSTPAPRVITGGVISPISHTVCGSISELLVAADLMARGYKPYMPIVRQRSHDILAVNTNNEVLTVEVRSGKRRADGNGITWNSKGERCASSFCAIVITGEPVIYKPELPPA